METGRCDRKSASGGGLPIQVDANRVGLEGIQASDPIRPRLQHIDGVIAPFAVFGPTDVKLVEVWADEVGVIEVRPDFHKRKIHALVFAEVPYIRTGMGALVPGVDIE